MQHTETIRSLAKQLVYLIVIHAFSLYFCSYAREEIDLLYSVSLYFPILATLIAVPIAAGFFLATKYGRPASIVLIGVFSAEAIYLIFDRFKSSTPIVRIGSPAFWKIFYEGSFGLTIMLDAIGFWLAIKMLLEVHKQMASRNISVQ